MFYMLLNAQCVCTIRCWVDVGHTGWGQGFVSFAHFPEQEGSSIRLNTGDSLTKRERSSRNYKGPAVPLTVNYVMIGCWKIVVVFKMKGTGLFIIYRRHFSALVSHQD